MAASSPSSARSKADAGRSRELKGETLPRVWTPPLVTGPPGPCGCGCALTPETSYGFAVEEFATEVLGVTLLPWQRWLLIHMLELLEDGTFRFRTVILLVARQNGKSTVLQILSLWFMYVLGVALVIGTAQNLDVAEEQWQAAVELAEEIPELAEEIGQVSKVNGKKFLKLRTGERYKVAAASRRGGRGLSGNLVILDELREHQSWDAWGAVTKTTMARLMAMIVGASNAGDAASVVLRYLRKIAHLALGDPDGLAAEDDIEPEADAGDDGLEDDESLGIFEWSAPPGCEIHDRAGWAQANPSLGYRISERAIRSAAKTDPEWTFRTEVLCQWQDGTRDGPFPAGAWEACEDADGNIDDGSEIVWCVDVSWDRSTAHVAAAGWRPDGVPQVEIAQSRLGVDWVVPWLTDPTHPERATRRVVIQSKRTPAASLLEPLVEAGLDVVEWNGDDLGPACSDLYDRVRAATLEVDGKPKGPQLRHLSQPVLNVASANAATRPVGDAWLWDRRKSSVDIAPLVAATGALWGLTSPGKPKPPPATAPAQDDSPGRNFFDRGRREPLQL